MTLQALYGTIPQIFGKGECARVRTRSIWGGEGRLLAPMLGPERCSRALACGNGVWDFVSSLRADVTPGGFPSALWVQSGEEFVPGEGLLSKATLLLWFSSWAQAKCPLVFRPALWGLIEKMPCVLSVTGSTHPLGQARLSTWKAKLCFDSDESRGGARVPQRVSPVSSASALANSVSGVTV